MRIFCAFILYQRERKRHWVIRRTRPCVLRFHAVDHFILRGRRPWVSKYHNDCVRDEICFKEIVSNTRLDLNHSFFTHLVCEFFNYLQIYFYIYSIFVYYFYLSHLFVLLLILRSVYCSFCLITKVNCWNIPNKHIVLGTHEQLQ